MWPKRGEALSRTVEAEAVLTDLYQEILNQWVPGMKALVLPTLTAAADLPPDPDQVTQSQGLDRLSTELIITGLSTLWSISILEAAEGLEIDLPEIDVEIINRVQIEPKVMRAITRTTELTETEIRTAVGSVDSIGELRESRNEFVESQRPAIERTTTMVRDKVAMAVQQELATPLAETIHEGPHVEVVIERQREAAAAVLTPGSEELRDVARMQGYQAAGVQNAAVLEVTRYADPLDQLQKCWIATIDGRTRNTHFAADGQRTPLEGTFSVGGAALRYPGDPQGPPEEVRNCRCRVGVLAADEELPDEIDRHTERLNGRDSVQVNRKGSQRDEIERRAEDGVVRAREDDDGIGRTAAGGFVAPSEQEYGMSGMQTVKVLESQLSEVGKAVLAAESSDSETFRTFTDQPIAFVGIETSDGRMLQDGIKFTVRTPPLPMMWTKQTGSGHMDAFTVGVLESARIEGDKVLGSGYWLNTTEADEAFELASHKVSRPSVDLGAIEWILTDENGKELTEDDWWDMPMDAKVLQVLTAAELIGTTMVATPAFGDTMIEFNSERETRDLALVASAVGEFQPRVYPAELFTNPQLEAPTDIQIDATTGRIFGHLACFGQCHRSIQQACVVAPRSKTDYAHFHTSPAVRLDNGTRVPVGRLTVGTGHAPDAMSGGPALAHYDNTGTAWALVRVGEDEHGIWVSGVAAPWATAEQIEQGLSSPLSGDWRDFGQGLELIAALSVNTPGFAVRGRDGADGRPAALVASLGPARGKRFDDVQITAESISRIAEHAAERALDLADKRRKTRALLAAADDKVGPLPKPPTASERVAALLEKADV